MGQVIKKQAEGDTHQKGRSKPAIEDEIEEATLGCRDDDQDEQRAGQGPLKQLVAAPEPALEEEKLVIEKSRCDQPQRPEGGDDVVRIVLGVIDVGVVLQMHPREDRIAETQEQGRAVAHEGIPETIGMGCVVAGVMDDGAFQMQSQEAHQNQHRQGPLTDEPTPDGQTSEHIPAKKQADGGVERRWRLNEVAGNRAQRWGCCHSLGASA